MAAANSTRRDFLTTGATGLVTGLAAAGGFIGAPAQAATASGGFTRERYNEYVTLFNAGDPGFIKFYHDDVAFELGAQVIRTPAAIRDFYAEVRAHIHEKVDVTHFVSDPTGVAVLLPTEFKVYKDWENG
ncbi:MAG: nuclear transport factor 2 family protein, partial [Pseudomonadota bacterium]